MLIPNSAKIKGMRERGEPPYNVKREKA